MKKFSLVEACIPFLSLFILALLSIKVWKVSMMIPIMLTIIITMIVAKIRGFKYSQLEQMLVDGSTRVLPVVYILIAIGMIVATWIGSGIIPTIIYYGVDMINPNIFLPTTVIVVSVIAVALGSSFTAMGTVGVAFFSIGVSLGFNPGLVAGAVISGAIFGDKISPLSDTTNVAPMIVGTDLYSHVRGMLIDTILAMLLTLIIFTFVGFNHSGEMNHETIASLQLVLQDTFVLSPWLMLVPVVVIVFLVKKPPVLPSLILLAAIGGLLMITLQKDSLKVMMQSLLNGYTPSSESLNGLLSKGGIISMLPTVAMVLLAVGLGNIVEQTGIFQVIKELFSRWMTRPQSLIALSVITALLVGFASGSQFLANILTGRAYVDDYKRLKVAPHVLSRCMESGGTVGIMLVPWSVPCLYAMQLFGIDPLQFIPFTFFAIITPLMTILLGMLNIGTKRVVDINE